MQRCRKEFPAREGDVGAYKKIVEAYNNGEVDFSGVTTINLDEYRGIKRNHEQSYWSFMQENLFSHIPIQGLSYSLHYQK